MPEKLARTQLIGKTADASGMGATARHGRSARIASSLSLRDLPTLAESGVPGYEAASWYGVIAG